MHTMLDKLIIIDSYNKINNRSVPKLQLIEFNKQSYSYNNARSSFG